MIDVVIRASRDAHATRRCLESVQAARGAAAFELVVAGSGPIEPHAGQRAESVEAALALHPDRDVVLLSAECQVAGDWLDRLAECARREASIATATPFSNNGGLCSYPRFDAPNAMPAGATAGSLDALFRDRNRGCSIEIPAAGAFCAYVRREALAAAGPFDDAAAFSERAARAGLRHLLCADVFVRHDGHEPRLGDMAAHPALAEAARDFADREPARPWRRRVDIARLRASPRPRVLLVTHNWGGGVERHVTDLARLLGDDCEVLRLRPDGPSAVEIAWLREGEEFQAWIDASEWDTGIALLLEIGISRVHVHHVHDLPRAVLDLPAGLGVPYDVTLHDYYPICPRYHLDPGGGDACQLDRSASCDRCLAHRPAQWELDLAQWRALFAGFLAGAARVIVPSRDAAARLRRSLPGQSFLEWSHPELPRTPARLVKAALLGGLSPIKGARVLEACVADAAERKLPLHFHVIGHVDRPMRTWPEAPLTIGGSYPEEGLPELIALARPDAFLFLSQVPETHSYTLTAAMAAGLPIVATRLGAFPERLRGYPSHTLIAPDARPGAINDALLACVEQARTPAAASG